MKSVIWLLAMAAVLLLLIATPTLAQWGWANRYGGTYYYPGYVAPSYSYYSPYGYNYSYRYNYQPYGYNYSYRYNYPSYSYPSYSYYYPPSYGYNYSYPTYGYRYW
jgi:hypothetical protein